jgi:hypothetical protein
MEPGSEEISAAWLELLGCATNSLTHQRDPHLQEPLAERRQVDTNHFLFLLRSLSWAILVRRILTVLPAFPDAMEGMIGGKSKRSRRRLRSAVIFDIDLIGYLHYNKSRSRQNGLFLCVRKEEGAVCPN